MNLNAEATQGLSVLDFCIFLSLIFIIVSKNLTHVTQLYDQNFTLIEDAKARKRRLNSELARALAVLGIKHSTFYSMLNANKHKEVKKMLKECLQERFDALVENGPDMEKEDFDINLEISDMTTIHESYQYLIKKYVDGHEDIGKSKVLPQNFTTRWRLSKSQLNLCILLTLVVPSLNCSRWACHCLFNLHGI